MRGAEAVKFPRNSSRKKKPELEIVRCPGCGETEFPLPPHKDLVEGRIERFCPHCQLWVRFAGIAAKPRLHLMVLDSKVSCPHCGAVYSLEGSSESLKRGIVADCPKCARAFRVVLSKKIGSPPGSWSWELRGTL